MFKFRILRLTYVETNLLLSKKYSKAFIQQFCLHYFSCELYTSESGVSAHRMGDMDFMLAEVLLFKKKCPRPGIIANSDQFRGLENVFLFVSHFISRKIFIHEKGSDCSFGLQHFNSGKLMNRDEMIWQFIFDFFFRCFLPIIKINRRTMWHITSRLLPQRCFCRRVFEWFIRCRSQQITLHQIEIREAFLWMFKLN